MTDLAFMDGFAKPSLADWQRLVAKSLKGADPERRLVSRTADGLRIEALYSSGEGRVAPGGEAPGEAPFTRGTGRTRTLVPWDIRQVHAGSDAAAINAAILEDLEGGASSVKLQIASPGWSGLAPDEATLAKALQGVLLDVCPIALEAGEEVATAARSLEALWTEAGVPEARRLAALNADPLGTLAITGSLATNLDDALDAAARLAGSTRTMAAVTALLADGHVHHAAGATEAQELAAVLSTLVAYLRALERHGVAPAEALPKVAINLAVDTDQMMGLAKLRAARRLVWQVADACGAGNAVGRMVFSAETAVRMMSRHDPWVNMLRTTIACATAAFGGADAITVHPFTWAIGAPDAFARRMARNTQIVLQEESGLGRVADPAGGSYAIEALTGALAGEAWALFQGLEAKGGMAAALRAGVIQDMVGEAAAKRARDVATGRMALTGVSAFPRLGDDGVKVTPWPVPPPPTASVVTRVRALRPRRLAEPFEALRDAAVRHEATTGTPPSVLLVCLGDLAAHGVRATWIANFLAAGGIASVQSPPVHDGASGVAAIAASGLPVVCLCGSDVDYARIGATTVEALLRGGASHVLVAGQPKDVAAALTAAGTCMFIAAGADGPLLLGTIHGLLGVAEQ